MNQWFDTTLVAISLVAARNGHKSYYRVLELPARSMCFLVSRRKFEKYESAEAYLGEQFPAESGALWVDSCDITEEVARRSAFLARIGDEYE